MYKSSELTYENVKISSVKTLLRSNYMFTNIKLHDIPICFSP